MSYPIIGYFCKTNIKTEDAVTVQFVYRPYRHRFLARSMPEPWQSAPLRKRGWIHHGRWGGNVFRVCKIRSSEIRVLFLRRRSPRGRAGICGAFRVWFSRIAVSGEIAVFDNRDRAMRDLLRADSWSGEAHALRCRSKRSDCGNHTRRILHTLRPFYRPLLKITTGAVWRSDKPRSRPVPPVFTKRHSLTSEHHPHPSEPSA